MDPCAFKDDNGTYYLYFGGIWGGQLQRWVNGKYDTTAIEHVMKEMHSDLALTKLTKDMLQFAEPVKEIKILDSAGHALMGKDNNRRFFEASGCINTKGKYYFSYSTGDTLYLLYSRYQSIRTFTYKGVILNRSLAGLITTPSWNSKANGICFIMIVHYPEVRLIYDTESHQNIITMKVVFKRLQHINNRIIYW